MRILVVEDHADLARSISRSIKQMGHAVDMLDDGELANDVLKTEKYDLLVLDLNLPGMDGLDILKHFRERGGVSPVLILTARAEIEDRVSGLDLGADDYLTKPFEVVELEARVRALLRRHQSKRSTVIEAGPLIFDTNTRAFRAGGDELALTPRERGVLEVLIRTHGNVVPKDQIFEHIFGFDDEADLSAIEIYISRLRKKLKGHEVMIRTIRGIGYMLEAE
ncbi:response regulator [Terasakiella sp. SH-1]|uniref:response regulator n=1 Tax=Terasakiella sp. SH-1 TaxID=2560057 RepID=UPI00107348B4|nr:response regulator [Terasakiella sp. SH-1]